MFRNRFWPSVTLILVLLNFIFFLISITLTYFHPSIIDYLALKPANIFQGKFLWTIILSMFIHSNTLHIFANMISLIFLGGFLERIIGKKRFIFIYLTSGIIASLFFILFSLIIRSEFNAYAVGASGAIFGIAGVIVFLTPKLKVFIFPIPFAMPIWIAIILALFGLWAISLAAGLPIGNTAHLGGFLAGALYGLYLRLKYKRKVKLLNRYLGIS